MKSESSWSRIVQGATKDKNMVAKFKYAKPIFQGCQDPAEFAVICRALQIRLHDSSPTVVLKALIVAHCCIMNGIGNRVLRTYTLGKGFNCRIVSHRSQLPQNVLRYARYIDKRTQSFARVGCDVIKAKIDADRMVSNAEASRMSTLSVKEGLLKETETLEALITFLLDAIQDFDREVDGDLIDQALSLLFRDLFHACAALCEAVINILEHFFTLALPDGQRALSIYVKSVQTIASVKGVLRTAQSQGHKYAVDCLTLPTESLGGKLRDYFDGLDLPAGELAPSDSVLSTKGDFEKKRGLSVHQVETVILPPPPYRRYSRSWSGGSTSL